MSSRSTRSVSADLAAANAALEVCAALLRAQGDTPPPATLKAPTLKAPEPKPVIAETDPALIADKQRLDELAAALRQVTASYDGGHAAAAAHAVAEYATGVIAEHQATLSATLTAAAAPPAPMPIAPAPSAGVKLDYATDRALRAALDRYFSYFEVPETSWRLDWRLFSDSGMPIASAYGASPEGIEGHYAIALPDDAPWRSATKLVAIEPADKTLSIATGATKPAAPSKFYIAGLTWCAAAGSITLSRSKKKLANAVMVNYPGDGTVTVTSLDATGNASGPAASQDAATTAYLDAVWWKMSAAAMGLIHGRGDALSLRFRGADATTLANPAEFAEVFITANQALLEKVDGEIDDDMRAKLSTKFDGMPERYRSMVRGLTLATGSNPPSFADNATDNTTNKATNSALSKKPMVSATVKQSQPMAEPKPTSMPVVVQPTPMPEAEPETLLDVKQTISNPDSELTKVERVSRHLVPRHAVPKATTAMPLGSGPVPGPAATVKMAVSRPDGLSAKMFGQKTIDEKFEGLDLEIEWDDDDDDVATEMIGEDRNDQTLPGVTPSVRRPTAVTVQP